MHVLEMKSEYPRHMRSMFSVYFTFLNCRLHGIDTFLHNIKKTPNLTLYL